MRAGGRRAGVVVALLIAAMLPAGAVADDGDHSDKPKDHESAQQHQPRNGEDHGDGSDRAAQPQPDEPVKPGGDKAKPKPKSHDEPDKGRSEEHAPAKRPTPAAPAAPTSATPASPPSTTPAATIRAAAPSRGRPAKGRHRRRRPPAPPPT